MAQNCLKPTPPGWPRISASASYQDPARAIDWLCEAFGFEVRLKVQADDGGIVHSELAFGDALVMVAGERDEAGIAARSPKSLGGANTRGLFVYVDDIEAHHARATAAGAVIVRPLATSDYGADYWSDRGYGAADPEGHLWYFAQRLRDPSH
ncbi:MAG TPA: VOC family protein [Steroidobacteraceae bacterium]|nr:VOC family protein [Steroidobacteraceae bacterium]